MNNILSAKGASVDGDAAFTSLYNVAEQDSTTYALDSYSGAEIKNLFDEDAGDVTYLTRSDWTGTFPQHDGVTGWYSPAMNIHRTPFSGRNNEYYSEDPYISGNVAAASMQAAAEKGMYTFIKHFALNDQENHRGDTETEWGACTFANEQSIRQLYLYPFEMCMKCGDVTLSYVDGNQIASRDIRACQALMTSFNRLGYTWTGGQQIRQIPMIILPPGSPRAFSASGAR